MPEPQFLLFLLSAFAVAYLSAFLHEVGHATMGWAAGYIVTSFGMGLRRPIWVMSWRGVRIYFCRFKPLQGLAFAVHPDLCPTPWQQALYFSGGILFNLALTALGLALWILVPWGGGIWLTITVINGIFGLSNLIPYQFRVGRAVVRSDGAQLVQVLRGRSLSASLAAQINSSRFLREHWERIGDRTGLHIFLLSEACAWLAAGDIDEAQRVCAQVDALSSAHIPFTRAYSALARGAVATALGQQQDATLALDEAQREFQEQGSKFGPFLTSCQRLQLLALHEDKSAARHLLECLAQEQVVSSSPVLKIALLEARTGLSIACADPEAVTAAAQAYEELGPSSNLDRGLSVYKALGHWHTSRGEWSLAAEQYRKALSIVVDIHQELASPDDRARYRATQAALLEQARACFLPLELTSEAEKLSEIFQDKTAQVLAHSESRERRFHQLGLGLLAVNALCFVILFTSLIVFVAMSQPRRRDLGDEEAAIFGATILLVTLLGFFVVVEVVYLLVRWVMGSLMSARRPGGRWTLILAVFPWIFWILFTTTLIVLHLVGERTR